MSNDDKIINYKYILEEFWVFLCSLLMYVGVGFVLGGVMIMVGEL